MAKPLQWIKVKVVPPDVASLAPTELAVEAVAVLTVSFTVGDDPIAIVRMLLPAVVHVVVAVVVVMVANTDVEMVVLNALAKTVRDLDGSAVWGPVCLFSWSLGVTVLVM